MSEILAGVPICRSCRAVREPVELLRVTDTATEHGWFVCRPSLGSPSCFRRAVPSGLRYRIEAADPVALAASARARYPEEHPVPADPRARTS